MPACEHCQVDPTVIKAEAQKGADARIKEVNDRAKAYRDELAATQSKLSTTEAALVEFRQREEQVSLSAAESAAGWKLDDRGRKFARLAYADAVEAIAEGDERPTFADWLKSEAATADPILVAYRSQSSAPPTPPAPGQKPPTPPPTPPPNGNSTPPPVKLTVEQVNAKARAIMAGGGTPAEKLAAMNALRAERAQPAA